MKQNIILLIFSVGLCSALYFSKQNNALVHQVCTKAIPEIKNFDTNENEKPNVIDPPKQKTGHLFDYPMDSVNSCKYYFGSWCSIIENKPKNYGKKISH